MDKGGAYKVSASSPRAGVVTLSFSTNWDRDDEYLTYEVYRDSLDGTPVSSQTVSSLPWARTQLSATRSTPAPPTATWWWSRTSGGPVPARTGSR